MLTLQAPTSKSVSHRMLIAAALAPGQSIVKNVLHCDDTQKTRAILQAVGATITPFVDKQTEIPNSWKIQGLTKGPQGGATKDKAVACDVGESGTTCRLLAAVLSAGQGFFRLFGVPRMHERPIGALVQALEHMGSHITMERNGYPPLLIEAQDLQGGDIQIALDESSQYLSGLLLAAPFCKKPVTLIPTGKKLVSWPYVALTIQCLETFGLRVAVESPDGTPITDWNTRASLSPDDVRIRIHPGVYRAGEYTVEGDWSGASYLLAAGAIGRQPVTVQGLSVESAQGDRVLLDILQRMGGSVLSDAKGITIQPSALHGLDVDMNACPDIVPTVAVMAAFAEGTTRIVNVPHLRIKECDRLSAVATELQRADIHVEELDDGLIIHGKGSVPKLPESICFTTYNDHRLAMSMSLLGLHGQAIRVDTPHVVSKSFPHFWDVWAQLAQTTIHGAVS